MEAQAITQEEFEHFAEPHNGTHPLVHNPQEWWGRGKERAGLIILDKVDHDWSWVAMAKNPDGIAQAYDFGHSLPSIEVARHGLLEAFEAPLKDGWWK